MRLQFFPLRHLQFQFPPPRSYYQGSRILSRGSIKNNNNNIGSNIQIRKMSSQTTIQTLQDGNDNAINNNNRDSQTITLPSGRTLGFAEYGAPRPSASSTSKTPTQTLVYIHGYPSSRLEAYPLPTWLEKAGIDITSPSSNLYILSPDRPGFGLSSPNPAQTISSYSADVLFLLQHLNLVPAVSGPGSNSTPSSSPHNKNRGKVSLLGCSGGGPFALACAQLLPRGTLHGVGIVSGAGPWTGKGNEGNVAANSFSRRVFAAWVRFSPGSLRVCLDVLIGVARFVVARKSVRAWLEKWVETAGKKAEEREKGEGEGKSEGTPLLAAAETAVEPPAEAANPEKKQYAERTPSQRVSDLLRALLEAFTQGCSATVQEGRLLGQDWGISFEDVRFFSSSSSSPSSLSPSASASTSPNGEEKGDKILIWHGTKDSNAPIGTIRYMVNRLPNAELVEFEGETHYTVLSGHVGEIVRGLGLVGSDSGSGSGSETEKGVLEKVEKREEGK